MNWLFACILAVSHTQSEFLQTLFEKKGETCSTCDSFSDQEGKSLLIFMSFSIPLESWKDLSAQLEKTEGMFVLKGMPDDSFEQMALKIFELKMAGVQAPIDIDPQAFERYKIETVPAIVLQEGKRFDRIVGNIRLDAALQKIADYGEVSEGAKKILDEIRERR